MSRFLFNRNFTNFSSFQRKFSFTPYQQAVNIKPKAITTNIHKPIIYKYARILRQFQQSYASYASNASNAPLNFNKAALTKDVIIYKYENPRFFKIVNTFGIVQLFVLTYVSESLVSGLRNVSTNESNADPRLENVPGYIRHVNFGENKWKYGLAFGTFFTGKMMFHGFYVCR